MTVWIISETLKNWTVNNVKQKYRIWCNFTYAQKQTPYEATEAANNFLPKTSRLPLDTEDKAACAQSKVLISTYCRI